MNEKGTKKPISGGERQSPPDEDVSENRTKFTLRKFKINSASSAETVGKNAVAGGGEIAEDIFSPKKDLPKIAAKEILTDKKTDEKEDAPKLENQVFRELAEPKMPELRAENRARLQMQSPTRLHFYWSVKDNPFKTLHSIFDETDAKNYTLVVKLLNQTNDREEISPIEAEGSHWFNVDADSDYLAEIGFYAGHRPFVRLMFSNSIKTPRRNPSPRQAADTDWAVSADSFAQVLDNSGFAQDSFEVALAGDDSDFAEIATRAVFANFFGDAEKDFTANIASEMRFALLALASGYAPEDLREHVSPSLFVKLQENAENLSAEKALEALRENFGVLTGEDAPAESPAPTVFGASLINFPRPAKRFFSKNALPKLSPVSSF